MNSATILLPWNSVIVRNGRTYVARLSGDPGGAKIALTPIVVGRRMDGDVEVVSGLDVEDLVAASWSEPLGESDIIRFVQGREVFHDQDE